MTHIVGTSNGENINGSALDDTIDGLGGADFLYGGMGNDTLNGGDGIDFLNGEFGEDILNGGDGDDWLIDTHGANKYYGGSGNDHITAYSDSLGSLVDAGSGNDDVTLYEGNVTVNLGAGDDTILFFGFNGGLIMSGGAGRDTYDPYTSFYTDDTVITDFRGGASGDVIKLGDLLSAEHWSGTNPFADGFLRLAQFGKDVLLQLQGSTIITLQNVNIASLTSANFGGLALNTPLFLGTAGADKLTGTAGADIMQGGLGNDVYYVNSFSDVVTELKSEGTDTVISSVQYIMGGSYVENATLTGTLNSYAVGNALDNILFGNSGNNNLTGGAGNDRLDGGAGSDGLRGGVGNDVYYVDNLGDFIVENKNEGTDLVYSTVSFNLGAQYVENLTLRGSANINGLGNALANTIIGNAGNNTLDGRQGADRLTGGAGADIFFFGASSGKDTITDFSASQNDSLNLHAYNQATAVISQVGNDTVIDLGGDNIITLTGTLKADVISHITW
ncbi:MAG: calcium-binding protein [Asticcacaulis sp.]|nr:calcium-binding protein [Asticcacaulis sp.]